MTPADELAALLVLLGVDAHTAVLAAAGVVGGAAALCGLAAQLAAVLPQATLASSVGYRTLRAVLDWLGGNYRNARNATVQGTPK